MEANKASRGQKKSDIAEAIKKIFMSKKGGDEIVHLGCAKFAKLVI